MHAVYVCAYTYVCMYVCIYANHHHHIEINVDAFACHLANFAFLFDSSGENTKRHQFEMSKNEIADDIFNECDCVFVLFGLWLTPM